VRPSPSIIKDVSICLPDATVMFDAKNSGLKLEVAASNKEW
jgi:hypothetical protein